MTARVPSTSRGGFTLLEVLLALGLCALLSGLWVAGAAGLMRGAERSDPEDRLLDALQRARRAAVERGRPIDLEVREEGDRLTWDGSDDGGIALDNTEARRARLVGPETEGLILLGGVAEAPPVARLRFYPDGTCDRARVEVRRGDRTRYLEIDPLTAAPLPARDRR